ncbi:sigma-70 family RNA polymerase sigma factor [Clostridium sp. LP20]|uniref:sigma-70 family RNA polymerase sigma factor n=1 Tax=Clostridium sp. LP20 TaxID=3418665 RepID=UPI003EE7FF68
MFSEEDVREAINGDDNAFMKLINECKEQLYRTAYAYVKDEEMSLDIVQETVCKAYTSIHKLREAKLFNTWIIRIAINISTDFYKRKSKVVYIEQEELLSIMGSTKNQEDERLYLLEVIDKMDEKHKKVIILKYFDDLTIQDISKVLDIPIGTVKTHLNKGLSFLREYMKEEVI